MEMEKFKWKGPQKMKMLMVAVSAAVIASGMAFAEPADGLFEKAAAENFKDIDNVQLHSQVRYDADGKPTFCRKAETLGKCAERLHAAGVEASVFVWSGEANRPETYLALWELGFDSFGTDYPEALYKAVEILQSRKDVSK